MLKQFITLPALADELGLGNEAFALRLSMHGLTPDGVVNWGKRRLLVFADDRVPEIASAMGIRNPRYVEPERAAVREERI
jgi:hypothetical protein